MATVDELHKALDRIVAGTGPKGDLYYSLSRKVAIDLLSDGIEELNNLRRASTEFVCTKCKIIIRGSISGFACDNCGGETVPHSHMVILALKAKIKSLEEQVLRLTEVISAAFDFDQRRLDP